MIVLEAADVSAQLHALDALGEMRRLFAALGRGDVAQPPQTLTLLPQGGDFITYPAGLADPPVFGVKVSPYLPTGPGAGKVTAWTLLMSARTGRPLLLCDSLALTTERTAATTALAVDLLLPSSAKIAAIVGTGPVAMAHLRHVRHLRSWSEIRIWSPGAAERIDTSALAPAVLAPDLAAAVENADVVLLCTSAATPVLDPRDLSPGTLVTSISTNAPRAHEIPPDALRELDVFCDYRLTTPGTAGEMLIAAEHGWNADGIAGDLADLVLGRVARPGNRSAFFRSVGLGCEDIAIAAALFRSLSPAGDLT